MPGVTSAYISLAEAQSLLGLLGQSTEVQITLNAVDPEAAMVTALSSALPGYEVESWEQTLGLGQVGMGYSQFAGVTEYMALISGKTYPTLGTSKLAGRATMVVIIAALAALIPARVAARREPSEALRHV